MGMDPLRKLIVLGLNELLAKGLVKLDGPTVADREDRGHHFCDLAGEPSVVAWSNVGYEELRVSVWWKYDHEKHPQKDAAGNARERFQTSRPLAKRSRYPQFVGACASAWLERKEGRYLQGRARDHLFNTYVRRGELTELQAIPDPEPVGYKAEGRFHF